MTLVAFHGRLGSGKDTAGERLAAMVDVPTQRVSFAAPLKQSAAALLDIPVEDWETYKNDPETKIYLTSGYEAVEHTLAGSIEGPKVIREFTAREFLQRYGTESHREVFGDNFWVEQALGGYYTDNSLTYVTDCRFVNEAEAVVIRGGVVVRVIGANEETGTHASETPLPDDLITFEIDNSIRGDDFASLDNALITLANYVGLPIKQEALR